MTQVIGFLVPTYCNLLGSGLTDELPFPLTHPSQMNECVNFLKPWSLERLNDLPTASLLGCEELCVWLGLSGSTPVALLLIHAACASGCWDLVLFNILILSLILCVLILGLL